MMEWFLHTLFYIHTQDRLDKSRSAKSSRVTKNNGYKTLMQITMPAI